MLYKNLLNSFGLSYFFSRSMESQLFNKANELQEDINLKKFDQRVANLHLAAIRAQVGEWNYIKVIRMIAYF